MAVNRVQRADGTVEFDVTGVTAAAADVTAGKKFVTAAGELADGAMPSVTQATPSISVSSAGLITASATQSAGKVAAGTKSATKQLTVQSAKTWTPGTTDQTIADQRWLSGVQTIKGDANLKEENIAEGVTIFGKPGRHKGGLSEFGGYPVEVGTCTITSLNHKATIPHSLGTVTGYLAAAEFDGIFLIFGALSEGNVYILAGSIGNIGTDQTSSGITNNSNGTVTIDFKLAYDMTISYMLIGGTE